VWRKEPARAYAGVDLLWEGTVDPHRTVIRWSCGHSEMQAYGKLRKKLVVPSASARRVSNPNFGTGKCFMSFGMSRGGSIEDANVLIGSTQCGLCLT
jgi:hypothetical protein